MQIVKTWPPNIEDIQKVFNLGGFKPVFTYGDKLYNPYGLKIPPDLLEHEKVHQKRQNKMSPERWWKMYLEDERFRLIEESEAYKAQAEYVEKNYNRQGRRLIRKELPKHLSSRLYGNLITKQIAEEIIYG